MTTELVIADRNGRVSNVQANFKKSPPPKVGEKFGAWAGRDIQFLQLPGGGVLQFDLSRLTLQDYRSMRDHYQINASLSVLTFMMHQLEWKIECENKKIAEMIETNMRQTWTRLIRAMTQAYWAGYAPTVIEYENNVKSGHYELNKFKDLIPEECCVNWKQVPGYAPPGHVPPKFNIFDGIKQQGMTWPIPVENSLWYPLKMENGNYYGTKLLKPAFTSWFFSILLHLWANRYYERFGEPVPVGRANYDDQVTVNGEPMSGRDAMAEMLYNLRSRSVVVLPSDRDPVTKEYDYDMQYLESQMRGADFERYLSRLDEEMSLSIFTPVLLFRTADVGSYNLGVSHMQIFLWMLNALAGDLKEYIDKFVVRRLKEFNFGVNAPDATWEYRSLGKENVDTMRAVVAEVIRQGQAKPDMEDLGSALGLKLTEIKQVLAPPTDPNAPGGQPGQAKPKTDPRGQRTRGPKPNSNTPAPKKVAAQAAVADLDEELTDLFWRNISDDSVFEHYGIPLDWLWETAEVAENLNELSMYVENYLANA